MALGSLLQRLREGGSELNSAALLCVVLQAHAALSAAPESFAALAGLMGGQPLHPILQVCLVALRFVCPTSRLQRAPISTSWFRGTRLSFGDAG